MNKYLTPEQDAALNAELDRERPKVYDVLNKMFWHFDKLSDIGQKLAAAELMLNFIVSVVPNEQKAFDLLDDIHEQLKIGIKKRYHATADAPSTKQ